MLVSPSNSSSRLASLFALLIAAGVIAALAAKEAPAQGRGALTPSPLVRPAQLKLAGNTTRTNIERFKQLLAAGQAEEAIDTIMELLESPSGELIAVEGDAEEFARFTLVGRHCQWLLTQAAQEAPEALALYRRRVDPLAKRWVDAGKADKDVKRLRRVVEQMFASRHADTALLALGEIALERGDFQSARGYWQQITPLAFTPVSRPNIEGAVPDRPLWLGLKNVDFKAQQEAIRKWLSAPRVQTTPRLTAVDSDIPPADVLARLVIASTLEQSLDRARMELRVLRLLHQEATGQLAGRKGKWVDLLSSLLESAAAWEPKRSGEDWPTFGGSPRRNRIADARPDPLLKPLWEAELPREAAVEEAIANGRERTGEWRDAVLSVHPVVLGGRVYIPQADSILSFDLATGAPGFGRPFDGRAGAEPPSAEIYRRAYIPSAIDPVDTYGVPRYTLTTRGNLLFARVGATHTNWPDAQLEPLKREEWGVIAGLNLDAEGKLLPGFPLEPDDWSWTFDGTPVCDGAYIYVAMRRRDPAKLQLHIACFEAHSGRRIWRTQIASRDHLGDGGAMEISHTLLTLDHNRLFVNTNMGVVASLHASGRLRWVAAYPRATPRPDDIDKSDRHYFRDLNPCIANRDLVFVAPGDCDRIFALEESSGRLVWTTRPGLGVDACHLLGVANGRLIASGDSIYWFDAVNGAALCQFPPAAHRGDGFALPEPRGVGRGVLADGSVYFPTRNDVFVFDTRPRRVGNMGWEPVAKRAPINLQQRGVEGGNLVVSGEYLLIAGPDKLAAFSTVSRPAPAIRQTAQNR